MKNLVFIFLLLVWTSVSVADTSDYIWNQQFEKKMIKAEQGNLKAQYDIGNMYLKGQGAVRNTKQAFQWFKKAAEGGHSRAQYKLGYLYHRGEGTKQNHSKGFKWVSKSAKQSYKPAMYYVGKLYASGDGVTKNIKVAIDWLKKSDAAGYNPAKREIKRLEAKLALEKKRQVPFDPRPTPVAKVVRAKPKAKPKPKPVKIVRLNENQVKQILLGNKWQLKGKPAVVFPSTATSCKQVLGKLSCESKEMEYDESYGVVSYTMQTTFSDFSNQGDFTSEYNKNVTLIFPNDPDDPDLVIPIDYGPQAKEAMRCKVTGAVVTCFRGEKREKVTYRKI